MITTGEWEGTIHDVAKLLKIKHLEANSLVSILHRNGVARRIGYKHGARGHPRILWRLPRKIEIDFIDV